MIDLTQLKNTTVRLAIEALQEGNKEKWFGLFETNATLFDDGRQISFRPFFQTALGRERFTSIDKIENNGLHVFGHFHSDQWGDFKTFFKFHITQSNRITKLEIGQAKY
ncbi:MAG TPA: hypothetical protein VK616_17320 [Flavitalea sp.]|nr:hypothetical protein [Flavitalea sp.]